MALDYGSVYRAHVAPQVGAEWTCFVEASSMESAWQKVRWLTGPEDDVYNVRSAWELIEQGESEDLELRLFEVSWGGDKPPEFCEHPVFLLPRPGDWARKWAAAIERDDRQIAASALAFRASYVRAVGDAFKGSDVDRAGIEERAALYEAVAARFQA